MGVPSPAPTRSPRETGFTLMEVLVAVVIMAVAFVALLGHHNRNLVMVANQQDLARATLIARQQITEMEIVEQFPELGFESRELDNYPGFRVEREVTEVGYDHPDLRRVVLKVIWDERIPDACRIVYYARDRRKPEENL